MRTLTQIALLTCLMIVFTSCTDSKTSYALNWSREMIERITTDANQTPDSLSVDTSHKNLIIKTTYRKGIRLKRIKIDPATNDTFSISLFSKDQRFRYGKEFCHLLKNYSVEVLALGDTLIGLHQFKYCNGNTFKQGFEYNNKRIGVWKELDSSGNVTDAIDYGNMDKLDSALHTLKY